MANPNIVGVTTIQGETTSVAAAVADRALASNPASSGKVFKINTIIATNNNTSAAAVIHVNLYPEDDLGGQSNAIAHAITVPVNSSLIVIDKSTSFYLKENQSIGGNATTTSSIVYTTSFEEISSS